MIFGEVSYEWDTLMDKPDSPHLVPGWLSQVVVESQEVQLYSFIVSLLVSLSILSRRIPVAFWGPQVSRNAGKWLSSQPLLIDGKRSKTPAGCGNLYWLRLREGLFFGEGVIHWIMVIWLYDFRANMAVLFVFGPTPFQSIWSSQVETVGNHQPSPDALPQ